jgi:hypothetical protein
VVERTFASIGRNFPAFLFLAALLGGVPRVLTGALFTAAAGPQPTPAAGEQAHLLAVGFSVIGAVYLVGAIAGYVLQAAIIYGTIVDLNGRRASFGECLSVGLRHWFWLLLLAVTVTVAEAFGYVFFIVPGLMMATAWIVAVPVQVVEGKGVFGAIGRSAGLTRGSRWPIFGLLIIYLVAAGAVQAALLSLIGSFGAGAGAMTTALSQMLAQPLVSVATSLVGAAGVASIYYELRSGREGVGPEALAAVFD